MKNDNMERKFRKFKRHCKKQDYGVRAKKQIDILNFQRKIYNPLENEIRCEIIKRQPLTKAIKQFPKEIQVRIYIFTMKNYWKEMMRIKSFKPMWCDHKKYIDNEMKKCIIDNVHFMHLDFNTLPGYKKWIPGCQCNFCKTIHKSKGSEYAKIITDPEYFLEVIHCYDNEVNHWNQLTWGFQGNTSIRVFDYLKGYFSTVYDQINISPHVSPIYFSKEVEESFN